MVKEYTKKEKMDFFNSNGPFFSLSLADKAKINLDLLRISYKVGETINSFDQIPPGIIYIVNGKIRLLGIDNTKEIFTLEIYKSGNFIGAEQILRGATGESLVASEKCEIILLPLQSFLKLYENSPKLIANFSILKPHELYSNIKNFEEFSSFEKKNIMNWAINQCKENKKVKLLYPGSRKIESKDEDLILSSENVENYNSGFILKDGVHINILGKLPARLLSLSFSFPNEKNEFLLSSNSIDFSDKTSSLIKTDFFEDWFGERENNGKFPQFNGRGNIDEILACLHMLSSFYHISFRRDLIKNVIKAKLYQENSDLLYIGQIANFCNLLGLISSPLIPKDISQLERLPLPVIAIVENHPKIIWAYRNNEFLIGDPINGRKTINKKTLMKKIRTDNPSILYIERSHNKAKSRFGFRWFIPAIKKFRFLFFQVILASFFIQILGLLNPLLIQQIIDSVVNQGSLTSLNVLGSLLIFMAFTQALLSALRIYLFTDTTNRIDISIGARIIHHLIRLPLGYFLKRPVGEISTRINELERIRNFLTGTALTAVLDSFFSIVYIAVMLLYSIKLTIWSLAVIPFFITLTLMVSPLIRLQLRKKAEANARVQSHMVEILSGIETIKAQSLELLSEWRWEKLYGREIKASFSNVLTSGAASSTSQFLQQISGLLVIWMGSKLVIEGQMTLGQLIAFRILSGYVTNPLLRLASLWRDFQETALSIERLSDIIDNKEELELMGENLPPLPLVKGLISFDKVSFSFDNNSIEQLKNICLKIEPGSFVGIVGTSGAGKSTLLKLLMRLFDPSRGVISIDGYDISKFDLYSLRNQLGVVLQDSLLFDGTIQENIAITKTDASFDEIFSAAKLACANEFIESLPQGFETNIRERGAALSGGQRQRIAIARMLLKRPKLLLLDEATSALDINTEKKIIINIMETFKNQTVIFATHRLNILRKANLILVMNNGVIDEFGSYDELMKANGRFATLFNQQLTD